MTLDEAKKEMVKFVELKTTLRPAFVDPILKAEEVKHGHWINKGFEPTRCSVCGITVDAINGIPWAIKSFKYCPNCGAKMDEVEDGKID